MEHLYNHVFIHGNILYHAQVFNVTVRDFKVELTIPNDLEYQLAVI